MMDWDRRPLVSVKYLAAVLGVEREVLERVAATADGKYRTWDQKKKNSDGTRPISDPQRDLKMIQKRLKASLLDRIELPEFCYGGVKGRSALDNAKVHVGQPEVLTMDFRSYFQTINRAAVERMWKKRFGAGRAVARLLALLTTHANAVPQGAPTSTAVANLVALPFATEVWRECRRRGYRFSLFVDDMTISGEYPRELVDRVARLASRYGLKISHRKTRIRPRSSRQSVTGYVVNRRISVPEERIAKARQLAGIASAPNATARDQARRAGMLHHVSQASASQARRIAL